MIRLFLTLTAITLLTFAGLSLAALWFVRPAAPVQESDAVVTEATGPSPSPSGTPPARNGPAVAPLGRLVPRVEDYLRRRQGTAAAVVYDSRTKTLYVYNPNVQLHTGSLIKLAIMGAILQREQRRHTPLTADEDDNLTAMMQRSDNDAATALVTEYGGLAALQDYVSGIGLVNTHVNKVAWGDSLTTAADMVKLMMKLRFGVILAPAQTSYALGLMEDVEADQRWGISNGVPDGLTVALKDGWYPETEEGDPNVWNIHSVGSVDGDGWTYVFAMLTRYPVELDESYGQETIGWVAEHVYQAVAGQ